MDVWYILLVIVSLFLGLGSQAAIKSRYGKWSRVAVAVSGDCMARTMLDAEGLSSVPIVAKGGSALSDYYDPKSNSLHLSPSSYGACSVAGVAVACHEAGHAVQHAKGPLSARLRLVIAPVVSFASNAWIFVFAVGIAFASADIVDLAIAMYAAVLVFELVTLPVEIDASRRAVAYLGGIGLTDEQTHSARSVLRAAAMTYVAAALASAAQMAYLLASRER